MGKLLGTQPLTDCEKSARHRAKIKNQNVKLYWARMSKGKHNNRYEGSYGNKRVTWCLFSSNDLFQLAETTIHCLYCGVELLYAKPKGQNTHPNGASLDNRDLKENLTIYDVDIICYSCNRTKSNRTQAEFLNYCKKVASLIKS